MFGEEGYGAKGYCAALRCAALLRSSLTRRGTGNVVPRLVDALGGNVVADNVDGILRHDDVFRLHLENFCNGARVFVLALHQ